MPNGKKNPVTSCFLDLSGLVAFDEFWGRKNANVFLWNDTDNKMNTRMWGASLQKSSEHKYESRRKIWTKKNKRINRKLKARFSINEN